MTSFENTSQNNISMTTDDRIYQRQELTDVRLHSKHSGVARRFGWHFGRRWDSLRMKDFVCTRCFWSVAYWRPISHPDYPLKILTWRRYVRCHETKKCARSQNHCIWTKTTRWSYWTHFATYDRESTIRNESNAGIGSFRIDWRQAKSQSEKFLINLKQKYYYSPFREIGISTSDIVSVTKVRANLKNYTFR